MMLPVRTCWFLSVLVTCLIGLSLCQLVLVKKKIDVPIGREVFLKTDDLQFHKGNPGEICKVEVVSNEPMTQRVGILEPQVFDCAFKPGTVKYTHFGFHVLTEDKVKLWAYKFLEKNTVYEVFNLTFNILNVTYDVTKVVGNLVVKEFFGLSNPIDDKVINFKYSKKEGAICKARISRYQSKWPAHGQIIIGKEKRSIDVIKRRCDDFLQLGLHYEHLKPPSPNIDYILIIIEVSDPFLNNGELMSEWLQLPVHIEPGFPNLPPKAAFSSMYLMDVDQFILTAITPAVLSASDSETSPEQLIFNVSKPLSPHQGSLVHLTDHTRPITSFRQIDLNNFEIAYKPPAQSFKERQMFEVGFTIFDGDFASSEPFTLHIAVRPAVTSAPRVSVNTGMMLLEGQSRPLKLENLEIVDSDNINDIQIFVTGGLLHGRLEVDGQPAISFTQKDIENGKVVYYHDDSDSTKDSIHLRIFDGSHSTHTKFPVSIIPKDDNPPALIVNVGLNIDEAATVQIISNMLRAVDQDTSDEFVIFLVVKAPLAGVIWKKFAWEKVGTQIQRFTQRDINKGLIYYHHYGNEIFTDDFEVVLQDMNDPPNKSLPYKISVRITPLGDDPPKQDPLCTLSLKVSELEVGIITSKALHYVDIDSLDNEILYTVTMPPRFVGSYAHSVSGKLVSLADQVLAVKNAQLPSITTFTQEQVNHHKIAYMPPLEDIGPNPLFLQFVFSVTDKHRKVITGQIFNITVTPVNNQVPQLHTGELLVEEGSSTLLSTNELSVYDPDTLTSDLQISLFTVPLHGSLRRSGQPLRVGDLLSLDDILTLRLEYVHDGSESFRDSFKVGVNDGLHFVSGEVLVEVEPVDDEMPIWAEGLLQHVEVEEGGEVRLTPQILAATDVDTEDSLLFFILTEVPQYGTIIVDGRMSNRFTQRDVRKGEVYYLHNGKEIGTNPKKDSFTLIVTDKAFPRLVFHSTHKVFITILPKNTYPPRVSFRRAILAEEGHHASITEDMLSAVDEDTVAAELMFIIIQQPKHGYVENSKPIPGYETSNKGNKISVFSLQDIREGFISYVQSEHSGIEPESDDFELLVSDGIHNSSAVLVFVSILLRNDEEPVVILANFTVQEGGVHIIGNGTLFAIDHDFPGDLLMVSLGSPPHYGSIFHMIQAENNGPVLELPFTELALENFQNVVYHHDSSENFRDSFTLVISDGIHQVSKTAYVKITPVNDEPPLVVKNIVSKSVELGDNILLSSAVLLAVDADSLPEEIMYKILSPPNSGILQRKEHNTQLDDEWVELKPLEFSQADVNMNLVRYQHSPSIGSSTEDSFDYIVTDGVHKTLPERFKIHLAAGQKSGLQIIANGAVVKAKGHVILNTSMLAAYDNSKNIEDIAFHILQQPRLGSIELLSNAAVPVQDFSFLDVIGGRVLYNHTDPIGGSTDSFNLMVTNGVEQKNGTFVITIHPLGDTDSKFPVLETISPLILGEDSIGVISSDHLFAFDSVLPSRKVVYFITKHPRYGILLNDGKKLNLNTFTQEDINKGAISYQQNASQMSSTDFFLFKISNGKVSGYVTEDSLQTEPTKFEIFAKPKKIHSVSVAHISSPTHLEDLGHGQVGFILTNNNLKAVDEDSSNIDLTFTVQKPPEHGYLMNGATGQPVNGFFTQRDIDSKQISFIINGKNQNATNDSFTFTLADKDASDIEEYMLSFQWAVVYFAHPEYAVCEDAGTVNIEILRNGCLDQSSFVSISAVDQTAEGGLDYVPGRASQVQFDPGTSSSQWKLVVVQDDLEEAPIEQLQVKIHNPVNAVLNNQNTTLINIYDKRNGECSKFPSQVVKVVQEEYSDRPSIWQAAGIAICTPHIYGLLHYNHTTGRLYQCNGKQWLPWSQQSATHSEEYFTVSPLSEKSITPSRNDLSGHLNSTLQSSLDVQGKVKPFSTLRQDQQREPLLECLKGWHLYSTKCYRFFRLQSTWAVAESSCNSNQGNLATVLSLEHSHWLTQLAKSKSFWIGLHATNERGDWVYPTSSSPLFTNWKQGFPRLSVHGGVKLKCVLSRGSGHWINRHCDHHEHAYICVRPLTADV